MTEGELPHVVIVGAGFGGLRAARKLRRAPVRITLVDRRNYHLFQPLLYQVATAGLSPEDIAHPVRAIFRRQRNLRFRMAEITGVDLAACVLHTSTGGLPFDWLILAPGGTSNFFGLDSVEANGLPLKDIEDAVSIRNQVLRMFETAVQEPDADRRRAMLNFVVVGGGPTGVESSGALSELIRLVLTKDYPDLDVNDVRVILLEATDRLLGPLPERLRKVTAEILWSKHVEVRFGAQVTRFDGERVVLRGGEVIPTRTLIWAAGVRAEPLVEKLGVPLGPQRRVKVSETLQLPGAGRVFVIGDAAYLESAGEGLPMMAPVAQQQADQAAANIQHALRGEPLQAFRYRNPGTMATIGRNAAVVYVRGFQLSGFFAWIAWLLLHIVLLIGFRNRLLVLINWAWDYFFYDRAVRLIHAREIHTGPAEARRPGEGGTAPERKRDEGRGAGAPRARGARGSVRVLIAGCGYVGTALAARLAAAGHTAFALRRKSAPVPPGVSPLAADLTDPATLRALPGPFDAAVYAAAPDGRAEAAYRAVYETGIAALIEAVRCERFLLTSSTSVYAQDAGEWVDEGSATEPDGFTGRAVLEGEAIARARHPAACAVRFGGIYGPGRARLLAAAREGRLAYALDPPRYTNRIHRDDAAGVLAHLLELPRLEPVYVGVDCEPAGEEAVYRWLAARVGGPSPAPSAPAGGGGAGKRASNRLLLASGYRFRFPTFREGYGAMAGAGGEGS